jgi:hypothetical protein
MPLLRVISLGRENIGNDSIVHIDLDSAGSGQSYVSITLFNTTLSFEDSIIAHQLIIIGITRLDYINTQSLRTCYSI